MENQTNKAMDPLDLQYIQILHVIKPYITCIMNNHYIELIKLWLEKLSSEEMKNKVIRNSYLIQLGKQIEEGILDEPFTAPPPESQLKPMEECEKKNENNYQSVCKLKKSKMLRTTRKKRGKKTICIKPDSLINEFEMEYKEDSSWMDLTDDNLSAAGDAGNKLNGNNQINYLLSVIDELKNENISLIQANHNEQVGKYNWQSNINMLQQKITTMQKRNVELRSVIKQLEKKIIDMQSAYNNKPQKCILLSEMHKKELELIKHKHQENIDSINNKHLEELENNRLEYDEKYKSDCCWYEERIGEMRLEIEKNVQEYYEKEMDELKNYYENKLQQVEKEKLEEDCRLRYEMVDKEEKGEVYYETKIAEFKLEYDRELIVKDKEIERLEKLLTEQCARMQKEVNQIRNQMQVNNEEDVEEKIAFLQKCVLKMDKMYKKAEREFCKQLIKLNREIEMRDKHTQILLSTQRMKLISNNSFMKQKEIDNIVMKLEEQYKSLLILQQNEALKEKRNDQRVITELREQLSNAAIVCDIKN